MRRLLFLALAQVACSSPSAEAAPSDSGAPSAADAAAASDAGPLAILPYPAGPYGTGAVGERLADFRVQGYALTPDQRDSTKLPFRDITLAEVRSRPGCECLVIVWTGAGQACQPCIEADGVVADATLHHPSLCALEIVEESFDSFELGRNGNEPAPPTRSDLDVFTQVGREPFPVGILTDDAMEKLGAGAIAAIPTSYVVRTSDMRIAGVILGRANTFAADVLATCAAPVEGPVTLAAGIAPRAFALDDTHAWVADEGGRILRVPRAGGGVETVATTADAPSAIALGSSEVYWSTATTIGAVAKAGGPSRVLATSSTAYVSIATDGDYVYFTTIDGGVGRVATASNAETTLATGEAGPTAIGVDGSTVYWLDHASAEIVSMPKGGGERTSLLAPSTSLIDGLLVTPDALFAREAGNLDHFDRFLRRGANDPAFFELTRPGRTAAFSYDAALGVIDFVQAPYARAPEHNAVGLVGASLPSGGGLDYTRMLTFGQRFVTALASGNDGYVYWITNDAGVGTLRRMKR